MNLPSRGIFRVVEYGATSSVRVGKLEFSNEERRCMIGLVPAPERKVTVDG
jgi:hypothetical protein